MPTTISSPTFYRANPGQPGFQSVGAGIARRQGIPAAQAAAILAASIRGASARAKRANPSLRRVK